MKYGDFWGTGFQWAVDGGKTGGGAGGSGPQPTGKSLRLQEVTVRIGGRPLLRSINLDVAPGEVLAVVGQSGSGKTTLLRSIAGLEPISEGAVELGGIEVTKVAPHLRGVGMVFQDLALYPHLNVGGNLEFPLQGRGLSRQQRRERVQQVAQRVEIESLLTRDVNTLSGGERQRVAIGRAIITKPQVLLLDEPLSQLDAPLRGRLLQLLGQLQREMQMATIYVTHDAAEGMAMAKRIAVMRAGELVQIGAVDEVYHRPRNRYVATMLGAPAMNFIPVSINEGRVQLPTEVASLSQVLIAFRPAWGSIVAESPSSAAPVGVSSESDVLLIRGQVTSVRRWEDRVEIGLTWTDRVVDEGQGGREQSCLEATAKVFLLNHEPLPIGANVRVVVPRSRVLIYSVDGERCWWPPETADKPSNAALSHDGM